MLFHVLLLAMALCGLVFAANNDSLCLSGATPFLLDTVCAPGYYCPLYNASDPATYPVQCAPTDSCTLDRLATEFCSKQGTYEPVLCKKGHYCPTPLEQIECPEDHICPLGQYEPIKCPAMTSCPKGSDKKFEWSSMIAIIIGDAATLILYYGALRYRARQQKVQKDRCSVIPLDLPIVEKIEGGDDEEQGGKPSNATIIVSSGGHGTPTYDQLSNHKMQSEHSKTSTEILCEGFERARGQLPLFMLNFDQLSLRIPLKNKTTITVLAGVTGSLQPGKVTAIMGPSGAGKTTLLNTVLGKCDSTWTRGGTLLINGVTEDLNRFRKLVGYVPQDDIMHRDLTVYENISYSANIRLPSDWTHEQRRQHVEAVIVSLQLSHVQHSNIGDENVRGISGGQRKRVNIGMELAAAPSLLLLDEPTSGLDSTAAMHICQVLTEITRVSAITIAMVIHQPRVEIWEQLDELLLLAPGGITVFQGPQRLAQEYFARRLNVQLRPQDNPADSLMDHIAAKASDCVESWRNGGFQAVADLHLELLKSKAPNMSPYGEAGNSRRSHRLLAEDVDVSASRKAFPASPLRSTASIPRQALLACIRNLWKQINNLSSLSLELGLALLAAFLMGLLQEVRYQGVLSPPYTLLSPTPLEGLIASFFFSVGLGIALAASSAGVSVFGEEQVIYRREIAAGHSHFAYYLGTITAQTPRLLLDGLHFSWLFHIINQPLVPYGTFFVITFLLYSAIYGLSFIVSFLVSRKNAPLLAVVVCLFFCSFTAKSDIPEGIQYLSASRWAVEAIFDIETRPYKHIMQVVAVSAHDGGYHLGRVPTDLGIMFVVGILYRVVAYIIMRIGDRKIIASS